MQTSQTEQRCLNSKRVEYAAAFKLTYGKAPIHTYFESLAACEEALEDLYAEASEKLSSEAWWSMAQKAARAYPERHMDTAAALGACGW